MRNVINFGMSIVLTALLLSACAGNRSGNAWMDPIATNDEKHAFQFSYLSTQEDIAMNSAIKHCKARGWGNKVEAGEASCYIAPRSIDPGICAAQAVCSTCKTWMSCSDGSSTLSK